MRGKKRIWSMVISLAMILSFFANDVVSAESNAEEARAAKEAYKEALKKIDGLASAKFAITDIDKDGVPECILVDESDASSELWYSIIYTYVDGKCKKQTIDATIDRKKGKYLYATYNSATEYGDCYLTLNGKRKIKYVAKYESNTMLFTDTYYLNGKPVKKGKYDKWLKKKGLSKIQSKKKYQIDFKPLSTGNINQI